MITEHIFAWHFKKVPRRSDARHRRSSSSMRADDESQKNGETKRTFASRRATASLAISSPFATLFFFFRLDATSNPKLENFPYKKKARDDDAGRRSGRCRPASREGFSKESARSIDDARSERRRPFPFLPGGGFLVRGASRFGVRC